MLSKFTRLYENQAVRHYTRVVAFAVFSIAISWYLLSNGATHYESIVHMGENGVANTPEQQEPAYRLKAASPIHLRIPTANIDASFATPIGVDEHQAIEVPESYDEVAWYKHGPTPGELGPAVILGHVDSYTGPAVLFSLGQVKPGDEIYVDRVDGSTATFIVERLERHEQEGFPTESVYGNIDYAGLRIITCTGIYDRGSFRYSHNLIVFARLKE